MALKKNNNLLKLGRFSTKDHKDYHILYIVGVAQKVADESNKPYDKSNTYPTNRYPADIRDLPPWILEEPKYGVVKKKMENNIGSSRNTEMAKVSKSATSQKITERGPTPRQAAEEALSHQIRETATII